MDKAASHHAPVKTPAASVSAENANGNVTEPTNLCLVPAEAWEYQQNLVKSYIKQVGSLLSREH